MSRRRRDPVKTRAAIFAAGERLFAERGFAGTSSADVADAAGVTKSLIHHHFITMRGLWEAVQAGSQAGVNEVFSQMTVEPWTGADEIVAALTDAITALIEHHQGHPRASRLRCWRELEGETEGWRFPQSIIDQLEAAQADGVLRNDVDPATVLQSLLDTLDAWLRRNSHQSANSQRDRGFITNVLRVTIAGLSPRASAAA